MPEIEQQLGLSIRVCPRCGAEFTPGPELKNLCPRCLMQSVLADSDGSESGPPPTQPEHPPARKPFAGFKFKTGDRVLDGYTIVAPVGHGGFGEVYHARSDAGKDVALKLVQRFLEIELRGVGHCLNLKHPNLVTIYDVRPDKADQHWIVMEYVPGESLAREIDVSAGGLPLDDVVRWLEGIAAGVEHLHQAGIVHRDLKPSNIFDDHGTVKVGDYGLSKFITASRRSGQTQSIGTLHYMAPEIGCGRYGREVDVYAVGVMLYEMLTGELPFDGETPAEILMKHLTAPVELSKLPPAFRGTVGRMLAKRPEERYGSLQAVMSDLRVRLTDAASGQFDDEAELPYYSSPGLSTWLEAPVETFQRQFAGGQARRDDSGVASRLPGGWRERLREHPFLSSVAVFLTFLVLAFPVSVVGYLFAGQSGTPAIALVVLLWLPFGVIVSMAVCLWALLTRKPQRDHPSHHWRESRPQRHDIRWKPEVPDESTDDDRRPAGRPLSDVAAATPAAAPEREDDATASAGPGANWSSVLGALLIALFWGIGSALLVAGLSLLAWPRGDEMAAVCSIGTGFFVASVIAIRLLFTVAVSAFLRLAAGIFCGASVGLAAFGFGLATSVHDEVAALQGFGAGLIVAGLVALRFLRGRGRWPLWKAFAALLVGVGTGLWTGGILLAVDARPDEFVAVISCGLGCVAASVIWFYLLRRTHRFALLRIVTALSRGAGVGLLVAAVALQAANEEAAAFLGIGAGFLACGITAYRLFVGEPGLRTN